FPFSVMASEDNSEKKLIYIILWRGCEESCDAFTDAIVNSTLDAEIILRNADGDTSHFAAWIKEASSLKADLVLTWGTSVTLGMAGTIDYKESPDFITKIPLVFMIVADPVGSRIIESYSKTGRENITGTRNRPPDSVFIKAIRSYLPGFKKLGMLYNSDEPNSVQKVSEVLDLAKEMNFELISYDLRLDDEGHPVKDDINIKMEQLKSDEVDFIYMGSSSFLRRNQDLFTDSALNKGLPVLSPYQNTVTDSNALLSVAARYEDVGKLAGEQALTILKEGKKPGDLPVRSVSKYTYLVNMKVARKLNLYPSVEILQFAQLIE
ncbi:MAG: ABC transporter substrate-binding protein, partial [Desulfobulbia bacterium]